MRADAQRDFAAANHNVCRIAKKRCSFDNAGPFVLPDTRGAVLTAQSNILGTEKKQRRHPSPPLNTASRSESAKRRLHQHFIPCPLAAFLDMRRNKIRRAEKIRGD